MTRIEKQKQCNRYFAAGFVSLMMANFCGNVIKTLNEIKETKTKLNSKEEP